MHHDGAYGLQGSYMLVGHLNFGDLFHLQSHDLKMLADWFIPMGEPESPVTSSLAAPTMHCKIGEFPSVLIKFFTNFERLVA